MREIYEKVEEVPKWSRRHFALSALMLALGYLLALLTQPTPKPVVIEKRIEVPVVRVVERRVEVPVERVVEKRVEVPVEKVVYLPAKGQSDPLDGGHRMLRVGMTRSQVFALVGQPYFNDGMGNLHYYSVASRMNLRLIFDGNTLVQIVRPN